MPVYVNSIASAKKIVVEVLVHVFVRIVDS